MAKRLTDTEKWKDDWYISLSNDDKVVWQWLVDNCNHAGICKKNMALLNLMCKVDYTEEQMLKKMENRVMKVKNIWFIPKFLKFQYPTLLSSKPVIISVVKELFANNLCNEIPKDFGDDYIIIKDKRIMKAGDLNILHGHEFGGSVFSPVNIARGLFLKGKVSAMQGHNHQSSSHSESNMNGEITTTWSLGCLCELHPAYLPINKWNHGFAIVEIDGQNFEVRNKNIHKGKVL